ncbi:DNA-primase RepB domain-containing protein [Nisaea sediminum]|uniref:DNA-primase RepB domain-containing protein n=2 Tax=Pseudomonadota TaxID=1224 RepID=UPI0018669430|nr:DNA-primase RepB domain-containing protein [Nisaea sediminum]
MSITYSVVERFVACFDTDMEIGILDSDERMMIRKSRPDAVRNLIPWLRHKNSAGCHIYARPVAPHSFTLLDDLSLSQLDRLACLSPVAIVETSPANYQGWIRHERVLEPGLSTVIAKYLADAFDADPSSADFRHFGRLPGFTNRKSKYEKQGRFPFVRLISTAPRSVSPSGSMISNCEQALVLERARAQEQRRRRLTDAIARPRRSVDIATFHTSPQYQGDLHRADFAYALAASATGETVEMIADAILGARDLAHKGDTHRQQEYARRTAEKAVTFVRGNAA